MNPVVRTLCSAVWLAAALSPIELRAADAHMTAAERAQIVQLLHESQKEFQDAVANVSDEQWRWKPAPERWSVGEVAEHILLAEQGLFAMSQQALKNPADPEWETKTAGKTELLLRVMAQRQGKATAPEGFVPAGKMARSDIMAGFAKARARTLKFAEETELPLKEHLQAHPFPVFNPLNAYQWVLYIPLHNERHDKQIAEVKATPGYPASRPTK